MRLVYQTPFIGYGVQGAGITVEWSAGSMNYAHSQWMQNLLDGGIILSASFVLMILSLLVLVNSIEDNAIFYILSIMLINYLVIMIVDSVSYYPFFILLTAVIVHYSETQRRNQVLTNIR